MTIEHSEVEAKLVARIPKGWGSYVRCGTGWYELLNDLDSKVAYLAPDYEIHQVKEKYGTLRFYYDGPAKDDMTKEIVRDLVAHAESLSSMICELCGSGATQFRTKFDYSVKTRCRGGWYKTLCNTCAIAEGYPEDKEEDEE